MYNVKAQFNAWVHTHRDSWPHQVHLKELFESHDQDQDGKLEYSEMDSFLSEVMLDHGGVSDAELHYFHVRERCVVTGLGSQ